MDSLYEFIYNYVSSYFTASMGKLVQVGSKERFISNFKVEFVLELVDIWSPALNVRNIYAVNSTVNHETR